MAAGPPAIMSLDTELKSQADRALACNSARESRISALQNPQMCLSELPISRKPQFGQREIIRDLQDGHATGVSMGRPFTLSWRSMVKPHSELEHSA
jgi:hypothetical protein